MALSVEMHNLLSAYDSFTNFAGGPDLPWAIEVYDRLEDQIVSHMIRELCYIWAAGQRAIGCYEGNVEDMAQSLFQALPGWDDTLPKERKIAWLHSIGIRTVLPEPEPRPTELAAGNGHMTWEGDLNAADQSAVEDMAAYFQIGLPETILLYRLGRALKQATHPSIERALGATN
jgi:hypothetical protein